MKAPTGTPCKACPFRKDSLAGYLGSDEPGHFAFIANGESAMPCHTTVDYADEKWREKIEAGKHKTARHCSGALIFRANNCKSSRDPEAPQLPADRETVLESVPKFLEHHGGTMNDYMSAMKSFYDEVTKMPTKKGKR